MKKKEQKISDCFVGCDNVTNNDLPTDVKHIRGLLSELLSLIKNKKRNDISDMTDSATVSQSETDSIDSFLTLN
jgi:hypothetical protein